MKTDEFPLDDLFQRARQQPPLVEVQEVHQLLSGAPLAAAAAAKGLAGLKSAAGIKGAVVAKTTVFTSQTIAMLSTVLTSTIIGSGLWFQHVYVQANDGKPASASNKTETLTEIPFTEVAALSSNSGDDGDKDKKKKKRASQKTGVSYSFPGSAALPSVAPEPTETKAPELPEPATPEIAEASPPVPCAPAGAAAAPAFPGNWVNTAAPTRPAAPTRAAVPIRAAEPIPAREPAPTRVPQPIRSAEPLQPARTPAPVSAATPAPTREPAPVRKPEPTRKPVEGVRGTAGVAGVPGRPGKDPHPCGKGSYHTVYSVETKNIQTLNTSGVAANRYLKLSTKELKELGITVTGNSVEYQRFITQMCPGNAKPAAVNTGKNTQALIGTMLEIRYSGKSDINLTNDQALLNIRPGEKAEDYHLYPWYITEGNGQQRVKFKMLHEPEEKLKAGYFTQVQHQLVPVLIESKHGLEGRIVFWFPITPELLEALPENVSQMLQEEYKAALSTTEPATADPLAEINKPEAAKSNLSSVKKVEVYPNPAQNYVNLNAQFVKADHIKVQLLDVKGSQVKELQAAQTVKEGTWSQNFFFEDVPAGTYLIVIRSESGEQWSQRLVVLD